LKTRKLLILRDAKNAENGKIAANWNVSGPQDFHRFIARKKKERRGSSAAFVCPNGLDVCWCRSMGISMDHPFSNAAERPAASQNALRLPLGGFSDRSSPPF
jgi:hypothetical protein